MPIVQGASYRPPSVTISPLSFESIGASLRSFATGILASAVYPSANLVLYVPFRLTAPITVSKLWCYNGATAAGNVDVGVYDEAAGGGPGTKKVSASLTAQAGTSALQIFDPADVVLAGGARYYLAIVSTDGTATYNRIAPANAGLLAALGCAQEASATLPTTATPALITNAYLPIFGLLHDRTVL